MPAMPKHITIFWEDENTKRDMQKRFKKGDRLTVSGGQLRRRQTLYIVTSLYKNSVTMQRADTATEKLRKVQDKNIKAANERLDEAVKVATRGPSP